MLVEAAPSRVVDGLLLVFTLAVVSGAIRDLAVAHPVRERLKLRDLVMFKEVNFYLYCLYLTAVAMAVLSYCLLDTGLVVDRNFILIAFNWAASLIVAVSSYTPWVMVRTPVSVAVDWGKLVIPAMGKIIVYHVVLLLTTIAVLVSGADTAVVKFAWRLYFMASAIAEITILVVAYRIFREASPLLRRVGVAPSATEKFLAYCRSTIYMRSGICVTIVLKYTELIDQQILSYLHMVFVSTGLFLYRYNWHVTQEQARGSLALSSQMLSVSARSPVQKTRQQTQTPPQRLRGDKGNKVGASPGSSSPSTAAASAGGAAADEAVAAARRSKKTESFIDRIHDRHHATQHERRVQERQERERSESAQRRFPAELFPTECDAGGGPAAHALAPDRAAASAAGAALPGLNLKPAAGSRSEARRSVERQLHGRPDLQVRTTRVATPIRTPTTRVGDCPFAFDARTKVCTVHLRNTLTLTGGPNGSDLTPASSSPRAA
jgi:hypothetical protein